MTTILFIHQSSELYGSDKTLFFLVKELPKHSIRPIVVLPNEGPLANLLRKSEIEVIISPVIKISRAIFSIGSILKLPFQIVNAVYQLNKKLSKQTIDLVHSNTLAVLGGVCYAKWKGIKHIWHVHEIIENPGIANNIYRFLVNSFSDHIVFNSKAALKSLVNNQQDFEKRSIVIYNGIENSNPIKSKEDITRFKNDSLGISSDQIVIGIVGRISRWKGHYLLLAAFNKLQKEFSNLILLIVGSPPPGQEKYLTKIKSKIAFSGLENKVLIQAFTTNIWEYWNSMDICVVPSTEPEPFGLVAIEAMYAGKPVIAAKHGGLVEIIEHQKTGLLFEPNNENELYLALKLLYTNKALRDSLAKNGQKSALERFTLGNYVNDFVKIYRKTIGDV